MQRVTRDPEASHDDQAALESKVALIRKHFPPSVANLYAIPRQGSGGVLEWWSELTGQPLRYHELKPAEQQALVDKYRQRQESVSHLADALQARGQGIEAQALQSLVGTPDLNNFFSVNGAPLVVSWDLAPRDEATPATPAMSHPSLPRRPLKLWAWLLSSLLLALLLGLVGWLWISRASLLGLFEQQESVRDLRKNTYDVPPSSKTTEDAPVISDAAMEQCVKLYNEAKWLAQEINNTPVNNSDQASVDAYNAQAARHSEMTGRFNADCAGKKSESAESASRAAQKLNQE